jgi:hypothetical protein
LPGGVKVAGNQTQIPTIQSQDATVTQLQQNANKVLRNLFNQITVLSDALNSLSVVGSIQIANLTVAQFQAVAGTNWLLCNGQTCVDTAYATETGNKTVPTLTVAGINTFIRVN